MVSARVTAEVAATIAWAPAGPLPRRLEPLAMSSIRRPGPSPSHAADSRVRTLPDGALCVVGAADPASGERIGLRVEAGVVGHALRLGPATGGAPGWRLLDVLAAADGSFTVLELVPGPPDEVVVRQVASDGTTRWRSAATAGTADALRQLLAEADGTVVALTEGEPPRVVRIDAGAVADVVALPGARGAAYMNGAGRVGHVALEPASGSRSWVSVDVATAGRSVLALDASAAAALDLPLGMDASDRPYGSRYDGLTRVGRDGLLDWDLEVRDAVVDGQDVWIGQDSPSDGGVVARALSGADRLPQTLDPGSSVPARGWRLAGRAGRDGWMLHGVGVGGGVLATVAADGSVLQVEPAPEDVWLQSSELQLPRGPAVTDAGEVDLVVKGPDALHVIRLTPASA
jgi:hypothetical protein